MNCRRIFCVGLVLLNIDNWLLAQQSAAPTEGLVAHYPLDGNGRDVSGNDLHGTLFGTSPAPDRFGQVNQALSFNGFSDFIDCGNRSVFNFPSNFTIAAWVKLSGSQIERYVVSKYADQGNGNRSPRSFGLGVDAQTRGYGFISADGSGYSQASGGPNLNDGNWHALAYVFDRSSGLRIYVDQQPFSQSVANIPSPLTNTVPLTIGRAATGQSFAGLIDEVRLYNRALSASEIRSVFSVIAPFETKVSRAIKLETPTSSGVRYQLETSQNLVSWFPIGPSFVAASTNTVQYVDAISSGQYFRYAVLP